MGLEDIKDQLKDQMDTTLRRVQDSTVYIQVKEKYDLLDPTAQKALSVGVIVFVALVILSIPFSSLMSANEQIDDYQTNKALIRQLLRTEREIKQGPKVPDAIGIGQLQSRVNSIINNAGLLPDQNQGVKTIEPNVLGMVPAGIKSRGLRVTLSQLNLRQVSDIAYSLQRIDDSAKLVGLDVKARDDDDHYFDVDYELAVFFVPEEKKPEPEDTKKKKRKRRSRRGK